MEITARQLGRIEAACFGLAEFTKNNSVAATLVNTIREQLDEVLTDALEFELPLMDDLAPAAIPAYAEEIRCYGQNLIANGGTISQVTAAILEEFGLAKKDFAAIIGVNHQRISEAIQGNPRPFYRAKFAEFFGE